MRTHGFQQAIETLTCGGGDDRLTGHVTLFTNKNNKALANATQPHACMVTGLRRVLVIPILREASLRAPACRATSWAR